MAVYIHVISHSDFSAAPAAAGAGDLSGLLDCTSCPAMAGQPVMFTGKVCVEHQAWGWRRQQQKQSTRAADAVIASAATDDQGLKCCRRSGRTRLITFERWLVDIWSSSAGGQDHYLATLSKVLPPSNFVGGGKKGKNISSKEGSGVRPIIDNMHHSSPIIQMSVTQPHYLFTPIAITHHSNECHSSPLISLHHA